RIAIAAVAGALLGDDRHAPQAVIGRHGERRGGGDGGGCGDERKQRNAADGISGGIHGCRPCLVFAGRARLSLRWVCDWSECLDLLDPPLVALKPKRVLQNKGSN